MDMKISESFGFWSHAKEYLLAAKKVKDPSIDYKGKSKFELILPAYYLIGHSIELALKSYLSAKGYPHSELRKKKFGHDLENLLNECTRRKLGREVKLSKYQVQSIILLNKTYRNKKFEYLEYDNFRLPEYRYIFDVAQDLLNGLSRYASNSPFNRVAGGFSPPAPTTPRMRLRTGRFIKVVGS